ncbi:MAG: hypothetical protein H6Q89_4856, partial [Myxococcaceae bacterium]|nr:hypothetical protein [Myxococcaceae bacterium]
MNKKSFVLGFLAALFLACFVGSIVTFLGDNVRRSFAMSADSLAGSDYPSAAPPMQMMPEPESRAEEGKMGGKGGMKKAKRASVMLGAASSRGGGVGALGGMSAPA